MAEPKLSRTGIAFLQNPLRRRKELGVIDRDDPELYDADWRQKRFDDDRAYGRLKTERQIEAMDLEAARRREMRRRAKTGRRA